MLTPRHCWRWFSVFALAVDRFVRLRVALLSLFGLVCCFVLVCLAPWRLNGLCIDPYSVLLLGHIVIWECCHCINSLNLPICISFPNGLTTWRELQGVGRKKKKRASRRLGGGFRRTSEGFKRASERFEGGLSKVRKVLERLLRGLRCLITCASNRSLGLLTWAPPCLPQCHALNSDFYLNFPSLPSTMPWSKFWVLFKTSPSPCLPQCHDLKSNSLFKPFHPLPSTVPWSKIEFFI